MKFLNRLFGKPSRIRVLLIDNLDGREMGIAEMEPGQLPDIFTTTTTLKLQTGEWSVEEAIPASAAEFTRTGKLTLKLRKVEYLDPKDIMFTLPSIPEELPHVTGKPAFTAFETAIREDDWRQNEFLEKASSPLVDIEAIRVKEVWEQDSMDVDGKFTAFKRCHVRDTIGAPELAIDLADLQDALGTSVMGSLKMNDDYVAGGFSLKTDNSVYYGIVAGDQVIRLCLSSWNDETAREILTLSDRFDLLFINWYNCDIIRDDM